MVAKGEARHYGKRNKKYTSKDAEDFRKKMKENNWTQTELAKYTGIPYQTINKTLTQDAMGML